MTSQLVALLSGFSVMMFRTPLRTFVLYAQVGLFFSCLLIVLGTNLLPLWSETAVTFWMPLVYIIHSYLVQ